MESTPGTDRTTGTLGVRLHAGFFFVLAVLVASAVLSIMNGQAVLRDNAWVDRSQEVMQSMTELSADFSSVESSARGFVLTGVPEFEDEFRRGKPRVYASIRTLKDLSKANIARHQDLERLESLAVQRFQDLEQGILRRKRGQAEPLSARDQRSLAVLATRDQIFQTLNTMREREVVTMNARIRQSEQSVTWAVIGFWSSSLIGLLALTGFFVIVLRYFDSLAKLRGIEATRASELEERVRERTTELSAANRDLEAFSYSVSHDLRAPLRAMHGYASILKKDSRDHLTADDLKMLERIQHNCLKMSDLTESLLALFRVGKADLMVEEVNLSVLVGEVVQDLRAEYPLTEFEVVVEPNMRELGDQQMLRVLMVNLIGNAMKFSSFVEHPRILIGWHKSIEGTVFEICDNGAGFDPAQSGLLFEPFQRLHTEREFSGTGIGLAMCRKIVTRHRGAIWLDSQLGKGTTVSFTLNLRKSLLERLESKVKSSLL